MEPNPQPQLRSRQNLSEYQNERDMDTFWADIVPRREPARRPWFVPGVIFFAILSVPWYLPTGYTGKIIAGLPLWVWTALACAFGVSILTAIAAWFVWDDEEFDLSENE